MNRLRLFLCIVSFVYNWQQFGRAEYPWCGLRYSEQAKARRARIVGGHVAETGHHPWHTFVLKNDAEHCGGSVIGRTWVLTAAHCLEQKAKLTVLVGAHHWKNPSKKGSYHRVLRAIPHPKYNSKKSNDGDIALLRVHPPFLFREGDDSSRGAVVPICLPDGDDRIMATDAVIVGTGKLEEKGSYAPVLYSTEIKIFNNQFCNRAYDRSMFESHSMVCAGVPGGGRDACQGDSGGALEVQRGPKVYQIGVVCSGRGCGRANAPGIYTKVSFYRKWIREISGI